VQRPRTPHPTHDPGSTGSRCTDCHTPTTGEAA